MSFVRIRKAANALWDFLAATIKWVSFTISRPSILENVKDLITDATALIRGAMERQARSELPYLRAAYKEIAKGNLQRADQLYDEAIRLNPKNAESLFLRASCLTYLQGDARKVDRELFEGLEINRGIASERGLDTLGLRLLGEDFAGMGHMPLLDTILKLKKCGHISNKHLMIVSEQSVANRAYLDCWSDHLPIIITDKLHSSNFKDLLYPIYENLSMFEGVDRRLPLYEAINLAMHSWGDSPPLLSIPESIAKAGQQILEKIGLPRGGWFVALHVREGAKGGRLRSGADADINDYNLAVDRVIARGGWVVRMGRGGVAVPERAGYWDYANSKYQSDWMDVFLWATCRFLIGTSSGPLWVPPTFGRPVLYTNAVSMGTSVNFRQSLMIPKLFWSEKSNSYISFKKVFDGPYGWTVRPSYDDGRTRLVSNTAEEIADSVDEMFQALSDPRSANNDTDVQSAFNRERSAYSLTSQAKIAHCFAEKHADLLVP